MAKAQRSMATLVACVFTLSPCYLGNYGKLSRYGFYWPQV